jgi:hypothetical protein
MKIDRNRSVAKIFPTHSQRTKENERARPKQTEIVELLTLSGRITYDFTGALSGTNEAKDRPN